MEISTSIEQGRVPVTILRLSGDLDANSTDDLEAAVDKVVANGATDILVDLTNVPFMSSAGVRALHSLYTMMHPAGSGQSIDSVYQEIAAGTYAAPHLKLLGPNKKVSDVIKLSGLDMYIKSYANEQEAIAAF